MNHSAVVSNILVSAAQAKVAEITEQLRAITNSTVQGGPFTGMILPENSSWGSGDACPKLLGTYEQEINPYLARMMKRAPERVLNVGCGEGYYAVGLAKALSVPVDAYDSDPRAMAVCLEAANLNGVSAMLDIRGKFEAKAGQLRWISGVRGLMVCDCEGGEAGIFTELSAASFRKFDLVIETHEFSQSGITGSLYDLLEPTHDIDVVREGQRDPSGFPTLRNLSTLERYLSVCEFRPYVMEWICAFSKERSFEI